MKIKNVLMLLSVIIPLAVGQNMFADTNAMDSSGLFYATSGERVNVKTLQAHIYSDDNANTSFTLRLDNATNLVTLQINGHEYNCSGWGGAPKDTINVVWLKIPNRAEAEAAAKWFSVNCDLKSPPGFKLYAQFVPSKTEFSTNEQVMVKFRLRNMDERPILFQRGGHQRGYRDNQYGFRAQFSDQKIWSQAVSDIGSPINFGGLSGLVDLKSGSDFEDQIDLKKWFAFDKPGTYQIHGFYQLDFYQSPLNQETSMPWNEIWNDYASADFTVVIK
jgi:hypothetical protein